MRKRGGGVEHKSSLPSYHLLLYSYCDMAHYLLNKYKYQLIGNMYWSMEYRTLHRVGTLCGNNYSRVGADVSAWSRCMYIFVMSVITNTLTKQIDLM